MIKEELAFVISQALETAKMSGDLPLETIPVVTLEMPKQKAHGDWATSVALGLAKTLGMPPREVAAKIVSHLPVGDDALIAGAEIAGPGFINLRLRPGWLGDILTRIETEGAAFGRSDSGQGKKIVVEFVSTNPNGPITVAGGRNAAIGDTLSSLLTATGCVVSREYYINDALNSVQMNSFGLSVFFRYRELLGHHDEEWEGMYRGGYITDVAREILARHGSAFENADRDDPQTVQTFRDLSQDGMIAQQKADLAAFGVVFDTWFSEATLHANGQVAAAISALTERGYTYEKDGALWLKSTEFGDDKDRVLIRADGTATYIAGDVAYHKNKFDRGFDKAINVWGADHAGYVARTKASVAALGYDAARLDILLYQLVNIVKDGQVVMSSKRSGNILELKADLIDEIGKDAARFFFLMRSPNSSLDIDIDLARKTEKDNPVYYVQYAHARIVQAIDKAREEKGVSVPAVGEANLGLLTEETETDLIKKLSELPVEITLAASEYAPHRLVQYARDLAAVFHSFYDAGNRSPTLRVVCDDPEMLKARLVLVHATQIVLRNVLGLLGLSAPERM
jgi:arginyl-tRNA synthetase